MIKKSKYGNKKVEYDGFKFDSQAEFKYYLKLKSEKENGRIKYFEMQTSFTLLDGFVKEGIKYRPITYKADFLVTNNDYSQYVVDVKGMPKVTNEFNLKFKLFHSIYPHKFVIARWDNKLKGFIEKETLR